MVPFDRRRNFLYFRTICLSRVVLKLQQGFEVFEFSRDVATATNFRFQKFHFFAVTPKQREIGIWSGEMKI